MNEQDDIGLQHEINALRTSQRWATLGILVVVVAACGALVWTVDHYWGGDGVRVLLICAGLIAIVVLIYVMAIGVSAIFGRQAMAHHNNVLNGLIQFQRADDYGEVARSVAAGMSGAIRSGNQVDARVLQIANQIAQQRQLTDGQPAPAQWWSQTEEAEDATFRRVE